MGDKEKTRQSPAAAQDGKACNRPVAQNQVFCGCTAAEIEPGIIDRCNRSLTISGTLGILGEVCHPIDAPTPGRYEQRLADLNRAFVRDQPAPHTRSAEFSRTREIREDDGLKPALNGRMRYFFVAFVGSRFS